VVVHSILLPSFSVFKSMVLTDPDRWEVVGLATSSSISKMPIVCIRDLALRHVGECMPNELPGVLAVYFQVARALPVMRLAVVGAQLLLASS